VPHGGTPSRRSGAPIHMSIPGLDCPTMCPDDEFMREFAVRHLNEPPTLSRNPIIRRFQKDSEWGAVSDLTSHESAVEWVRELRDRNERPPKSKNPFRLRPDYRLTPESLPVLLDILSSEDWGMAFTALFALSMDGAQITSDKTDTTDATVFGVTLPDGIVHECPINAQGSQD
jgi:hypothetical protein